MHIDLDPSDVALIREKVDSGRFRDPSEVVREAVRQMDERDRRLQRLRADIAIGVEQAERGELLDFTPELLDRLAQEAEDNARRGKPIKDAFKP